MPVSRTNFRAGDRVRGAAWFDEIAGVVGTVVQAVEVRGDDWAAQDLLVRFDRLVIIFDDEPPQWTFCHSAHNFEYIENAHATPGLVRAMRTFSASGGAWLTSNLRRHRIECARAAST